MLFIFAGTSNILMLDLFFIFRSLFFLLLLFIFQRRVSVQGCENSFGENPAQY
jgi:hypothetical protein